MSDERRKFYRLAYPLTMMPPLNVDGLEYPVTELSEAGLRIRCADPYAFKSGDELRGEISLPEGEVLPVTGVVLRRDGKDIVIAPLEGVSFKRIVAEQRRVLSQCPNVRLN